MGNGDDSAYYLSRGFRVLAIEANPVAVEAASRNRDLSPIDLAANRQVMHRSLLLSSLPLTCLLGLAYKTLNMFP